MAQDARGGGENDQSLHQPQISPEVGAVAWPIALALARSKAAIDQLIARQQLRFLKKLAAAGWFKKNVADAREKEPQRERGAFLGS